jgi:hypothetical protein
MENLISSSDNEFELHNVSAISTNEYTDPNNHSDISDNNSDNSDVVHAK